MRYASTREIRSLRRILEARPHSPGWARKANRGGRIRTGDLLVPNQADSASFPTPRTGLMNEECPAGFEPARPPWQGSRLPLHHGHSSRNKQKRCVRIVKENERAQGGTRTHVPAIRARSPCRWTTRALPPIGTRGNRTLSARLRAGSAAVNTWDPRKTYRHERIDPDGVGPPSPDYRPGLSR